MMMRLSNRKAIGMITLLALLTGGLYGVIPAQVAAQTTAVAPAKKTTELRFSQIDVKGNQRIETATIRNFAGVPTGELVSPGQINAAYQKLKATDLFEEVSVEPRGGRLVITVKEFPTINRVSFERNKRLKDEKLAEVIRSSPRHTYNPALAEADAARIVDAYRQAGRQTAEVKPKIIRRSDNRVDLVFEIFEGKVVEIQRLSFIGNRTFSDRRLRRVLGTKQAGIFRALIKTDTFIADRVEFDKQVLTDFYSSRGFIDFEVLSVATEVARERNGFFLTFNVREGQSYTFGEITTSSDLAEIDPDEFHASIRVKTGVTYSPTHLDSTVTRMEALATKKGLNFIRITPRVTRHDDTRTLDIELVIERGPRIFVERIDIEGNTTTLDRVIRRQFDTVEGDPFNGRKTGAAANRIRALGFFVESEVTAREGSSPDRVIVDVDVQEQNTGSLSFGVTYGATGGFGGTVSLSESNFLGRGQYLNLSIGGGDSNFAIDATFAEPAFLDRNVRFELSVSQTTTTQQNTFFDTASSGIAPSITFPTSENGRLRLEYALKSKSILNQTGTPSVLITTGARNASTLGFTYTFDNRGSGFNPRAGMIFRLSQEFAGLGGQSRFTKTTAMIGARTTAFNDEVTFSVELEGGLLKDFSGTSAFTDRFFLGPAIMRGYQASGIGPRDLISGNLDALGGNMYAVARFESNFPIGLPEEYGVTGGLFMDVGSLWGLDNNDGGLTAGDGLDLVDANMHLRAVIGFSLFWETAVGPLRFNFSKVLTGVSYDNPESFSFTIGTSF